MRHIKIVILLLIFPLLISLSACGKSPEKARKELAQMNIEYTKENFFKHAEQGDTTVVKLFLDAGMDPNSAGDRNLTALHFAASAGHTATVQALLSAKANVNVNSYRLEGLTSCCELSVCNGVTPLILAILNGHVDSAKVLLNEGADVNAKMETSMLGETVCTYTPLSAAVTEKGFGEVVKMLIHKGADVNVKRCGHGYSVLHEVSSNGDPDIVKLLIDKGANVNVKTDSGVTALSLADTYGHAEIVKLLKNAGAKE